MASMIHSAFLKSMCYTTPDRQWSNDLHRSVCRWMFWTQILPPLIITPVGGLKPKAFVPENYVSWCIVLSCINLLCFVGNNKSNTGKYFLEFVFISVMKDRTSLLNRIRQLIGEYAATLEIFIRSVLHYCHLRDKADAWFQEKMVTWQKMSGWVREFILFITITISVSSAKIPMKAHISLVVGTSRLSTIVQGYQFTHLTPEYHMTNVIRLLEVDFAQCSTVMEQIFVIAIY